MKLRPTIFLSGVSNEFRSFRDAVETEIQKKDCFPLNQPSFGVDYRTIEEILRRNIGEADAVIHIVGFRFGLEPRDRPPDKLRRSYTQMEYDIALELNKPLYVFLSADVTVRDANTSEQPEDAEAIQLQLAHRQVLEQSNNIRYSFQNKNDLCLHAAGIPLLATADLRVDISRIVEYAPAELVGREDELKLLDDAWLKVRRGESKRPHVLTFVALGGEGKTSLVAKWAAQLAYENWPGCDSAFAWSFYSQGSHEQSAASSDLFLKEAISFFGNDADREFAASNAGANEKGRRLARIVSQRRALLILDGLEPLQYAPTSPTPGELKDSGIATLLKVLAANSDGLCVVTTRYSLPNLKAFWQTTAPEIPLTRLSLQASVHLLKSLEVKGSRTEFEKLVEVVKGHALTLNLLGTYLRDAHGGDIRRRDLVKLEEANTEEQGGHAFRVMAAYEKAFKNEGTKGKRALAILRLLGLFDRPLTAGCLAALLEEPIILGLTDPLFGLTEPQRNLVFKRLEDSNLLTINRDSSSALNSLDAHPLLREYFAQKLRTKKSDVWRSAHKRLYEHLYISTPQKPQPTLEDLQPLYQAVVHGCHAGLQHEVYQNVYFTRIKRGNEYYSVDKLGAFASDLGAIGCFFDKPWKYINDGISQERHAMLLGQAGTYLQALGRLTESFEPMEVALEMDLSHENWKGAAVIASNLSGLELILGKAGEAVNYAEQSLTYANRSNNAFQQITKRVRLADVLHQAGRRDDAERYFHEAEGLQREWQSEFSLLYSMQGFLFCDLLLSDPERAAWQRTIASGQSGPEPPQLNQLPAVHRRAAQTIQWAQVGGALLDIAFDQLTLGRIAHYKAVLSETLNNSDNSNLRNMINEAVEGLRRSGNIDELPRGLLIRSWFHCLMNIEVAMESGQEDLDEAWEIAERGPMRLFMADIHLYRARLFFREKNYPWESAEADLRAARKLIEQCGYWRRKEELEDAERVILKKSV